MKRLGGLSVLFFLGMLVIVAALPAAAVPLAKPEHTRVPENPAPPWCPVSPYAEAKPPDPQSASWGWTWYGNDALWASGGPWKAGADGAKLMWYRVAPGRLAVSGRRLDSTREALVVAHIPEGYGDRGLQVSGVYFPTGGCWEITGAVSGHTLSFVLWVEPGDAPGDRFPVFAQRLNSREHLMAFEDLGGHYLYAVLPDEKDPLAVSVSVLDVARMTEVMRKPWPAFCQRLLVVAANGDWICAYGDGEKELVRLLNVDFALTGAPHSLGYVKGQVLGSVMTTAGRLHVVTEGAQVAVVDVPRQRILHYKRLPTPPEAAGVPGMVLLSPDGERLYLGFGVSEGGPGAAQTVRSYDTASWNMLGDFDLQTTPALRLLLNEKGDRLYGVGAAGRVSVYDTMTFQQVEEGV